MAAARTDVEQSRTPLPICNAGGHPAAHPRLGELCMAGQSCHLHANARCLLATSKYGLDCLILLPFPLLTQASLVKFIFVRLKSYPLNLPLIDPRPRVPGAFARLIAKAIKP